MAVHSARERGSPVGVARSRRTRVDVQGSSCPSLPGPDTLNKEQCCVEEIRTVDGSGAALVGRRLDTSYP